MVRIHFYPFCRLLLFCFPVINCVVINHSQDIEQCKSRVRENNSRGQSQTTFWALLKESSKLLGYLVIMDNGTKNMCQSPVIPVIWLLVTYLICKTGPIAHATPLSLVIWLFGYWWQLICKTGPCISSVTGYLVIWLLTFYYLVFLRPWRLRGPRGEYFSNN